MSRWALALLLLGCPEGRQTEPVVEPSTVVDAARERPVLEPVRVRFTLKIRSKPLDVAGTTNGGLVIDRPGRGRLELFGPLGGSLVTAASDGEMLGVVLPGQKKFLAATDAEAVLRETTGGVAGIDDLLALLTGDLPFDDAAVRSIQTIGDGSKPLDGARVLLEGPNQTVIEAILDPATATPKYLVARDAKGESLLTAAYDRFELVGDTYVPTRVDVYVPAIDLSLEARYRSWEPLAEVAQGTFQLRAPDDYTTESLESAVRRAVGGVTEPRSSGSLAPEAGAP